MTDYFTRDHRKNSEVDIYTVKVERAGIGEKEYQKRHGENSLHLNGYKIDSLIMQIGFTGSAKALIHFDNKRQISKLLKAFNVKDAKSLEGKRINALMQDNVVVGIRKE